jgi:hypothetical protein
VLSKQAEKSLIEKMATAAPSHPARVFVFGVEVVQKNNP